MKRFTVILAMVLSAAMMLTTLTGCGDKAPADLAAYADTVAATYGDEKIMLDEANFFLRYQQMGMENYYWSYYTSYFGYPSLWVAPYDEYKTLDVYLKQLTMQQLRQTRILRDHASEYGLSEADIDKDAAAESAKELVDGLDPAFSNFSDVTVEKVTAWFEQNDLAYKVYEAVKDAAEVSYTDEETQMYSIKYVSFTNDEEDDADAEAAEGEDAEPTEAAEKLTAEQKARAFYEKVLAGGDISSLATEEGLTASSASYLLVDPDNTTNLYKNTKDYGARDVLIYSEGETWYVVYRVNDIDEDATADKVESVTDTRKNEAFNEIYKGWQDASPKFATTDAWDELVVSDGSKMIPETTAANEEADDETAPAEEPADAGSDDGLNAVDEGSGEEIDLSDDGTAEPTTGN